MSSKIFLGMTKMYNVTTRDQKSSGSRVECVLLNILPVVKSRILIEFVNIATRTLHVICVSLKLMKTEAAMISPGVFAVRVMLMARQMGQSRKGCS